MRKTIVTILAVYFVIHSYGQKLRPGEKIEHVKRDYELTHFTKHKSETATVIYDRLILADGAIENDCGQPVCTIQIKFSSNLPAIDLEAFDIFIDTTYDINNDGTKELLIYNWWVEHSWTTITVYSLQHNKWKELQSTKAFVVEEEDYKNRVLKKGKQFYLIGDQWNKDYSATYKSKKRIKNNL